MKTPSEHFDQWPAWSDLDTKLAFIAEIQRDAREGMVDAHDIVMMTATLEDFVRQYGMELELLRAKHPNLFTK